MVERDETTLTEPIKAFHKFTKDVREAAILLTHQGYKESGGKIRGQRDGDYIQDKVDLTDLKPDVGNLNMVKYLGDKKCNG